jgi:restriction endonuclease S subunit
MLKDIVYTCKICKTKPDQISHHKSHLETQKHKDKKELFKLKLEKLSESELLKLYNTININDIINEYETSFLNKTLLNLQNTENPLNEKKLINNDYINNIITKEDKIKLMIGDNISNKEALKDKIHEIHNYLRNNGAGYGMNALKVFNLLYGLKKIEEKQLLDKVKLKRPECEFSHLLKLANENKDNSEIIAELILKNVLDSIHNSDLKDLLFYEIPKNIKGKVFVHLIKEISKITKIEESCNVLLSGKIYEYFIGRDESAISELGAYFTDRHIVDYIYKKLNTVMKDDGNIDTMIDMFGGSGGFTTGYINYINNKYNNINWKQNINKIYHFDMNDDVIKSAGLEIFCLTGVLPNMKDNLKYKNSFVDEFNNQKFKNVITNPPYGGDKNVQSDAQIKAKKIKEYIKNELPTLKDDKIIKTRLRQLKKIDDFEKQNKKDLDKNKVSIQMCSDRIIKYAKKYNLKGNDKEACSLILMMDLLDINGTAIGVLKEGVFFNKTYKDLRKCLIENFNVREVISVPQDQFENTSTKTSIVIFDNTKEKTSTVKFYELVVEKYSKDKFEEIANEIVLTENKDDISGISDKLISQATLDELINNPICSLNGKDYNKKVIKCSKDYKLVKLGDICNTLPTTKHTSNSGKESGKYRLYCSSQTKKLYVDFCEVKDESIIIGQGGQFNIHYDRNFTPSKHVCVLQHNEKNNNVLKYLYYLIPEMQKSFKTNGSVISWLNKTNIKDLNLPIPKDENKIQEWVDKISKPYDKKLKSEEKIKELENKIKDRIKEIEENEDCEDVKLGDIATLENGSQLDKKNLVNGIYPVYGGGNNIVGYHNKYNRENCTIISGTGNCGLVQYNPNKFWASQSFTIKSNNNLINKWLYFYCKSQQTTFINFQKGSAQKFIRASMFKNLEIPIPKNKQHIKDLEPLFEEIEKLQNKIQEYDTKYKELVKDLSEEAIPTKNNDNNLSDNIKIVKNVKNTKNNKEKSNVINV